MQLNLHKLALNAFILLLFLMMFAPTAIHSIKVAKIVLLLFIVAISFLKYFRVDNCKTHMASLMYMSGIMVIFGLLYTLVGLLNGTPGAVSMVTVYVVWPILFTIIIFLLNKNSFDKLYSMMVFVPIAICIYAIFFVLVRSHIWPGELFLEIYDAGNMGVGFHEGYIETSMPSMGTLMFLLPFVFTILCFWPPQYKKKIGYALLYMALLLGLAMVLVSGRKALILVLFLSPLLVYLFSLFITGGEGKRLRRLLLWQLFFSLVILLILFRSFSEYYEFSLDSILLQFMSGFDFESSMSSYYRLEQYYALINSWMAAPFFGNGFGAVAAGSIRNESTPWAYELYYLALLNQVGIFGILVYASGILWIYANSVRIISKGGYYAYYMLPAIVGMTCFLIATATNPYLTKFDFMWVIFIPVAIINSYYMQQNKLKKC